MSDTALVEVSEASREAVRQLLPELPDYVEAVLTKLEDDNGLHFNARELTSVEKQTICRTYARTGSLERTCDRAKVSLSALYRHLQVDDKFRAAFSLAKLSIGDAIQTVSVKRALTDNGVVDRMCQLKRFFPKVYRESQTQVAVGVSIQFNPHPAPA